VTSVIDAWRAVDPQAQLVSGSLDRLTRPVRGVARGRAGSPHLPPAVDDELLVLDASLVPAGSLDGLLATLREAELRPAALLLAGPDRSGQVPLEAADDSLPILRSQHSPGPLADAAAAHLVGEAAALEKLSAELRLATAEAALADPHPGAAAGLLATRIRRGVAVAADGELRTVNPRPAGRALAARFIAVHARLLVAAEAATSARVEATRRSRDGMWLLERRVRQGASVWLFDDLPFARVDEVAADALTITLRALLRRPAPPDTGGSSLARSDVAAAASGPAPSADRLRETLLAVARHNGRVAPAARALGVHRNTVLYRLRLARGELGIDPRRPEDALRLLAEDDAVR